MSRLQNKVTIISGGAKGIGRTVAELFAEQGAHVVVGDIDTKATFSHPMIEVQPLDVANTSSWEQLIGNVVEAHGRIDILVNNAGLVGSYDPIDSISMDDWRYIIDVNQNGVFYGMRTVLPIMRSQKSGSIVNISSIWGLVGAPGVSAYQASKAAVRMMSKNAALSYVEDGIRVNSLHPGLTSTPMIDAQDAGITDQLVDATPMKRAGSPIEIAYAALFLASDEASFVTGAELAVDGGYTAM